MGIAVTVLLDVIKICALPAMDSMTPGQTFGATLYLLIFFCKFGIVAAIYMYQQKEDQHPTAFAFSQMTDTNARGRTRSRSEPKSTGHRLIDAEVLVDERFFSEGIGRHVPFCELGQGLSEFTVSQCSSSAARAS